MAVVSSGTSTPKVLLDPNKNYTAPLVVVTALFFMWGFITCMNDILIPHLKEVFQLTFVEAMLIQLTFFGAFFIMSIPSGWIISKIGYKNGIIVGLALAGIGCFMFYPAAETRIYIFFLAALFVLASGITVLQVAANPYVAILGKVETSSSRLNLAQAFNSLGTTIAPYIGKILIFTTVTLSAAQLASLSISDKENYFMEKVKSVEMPYVGLAVVLFVLAVLIKFSSLPSIDAETEDEKGSFAGALKHSHLLLGVIAIFMYVGGEVSIGSFLINFLKDPKIAGFDEHKASEFVSYYWGGAMFGRFIGAALLSKINPEKALGAVGLIVVSLLATTLLTTGSTAMWSVIAIGFFNSIMFPTIFTLAIRNLGIDTNKGSSLLIMAIVGGALVPVFQGMLADKIGVQASFILPVVCYLYVMYYGFIGSKVRA